MDISWTYVILTLILAYYWIYGRRDPPLSRDVARARYDYVIVGAGTAGSVLAARLSEDPEVTVLLLEAGSDDAGFPDIKVPFKTFEVLSDDRMRWLYQTTPQTHACFSMRNNQCQWPRGKVVGGSGALNCMIYMRGHPADYDQWAEMGCEGWGYEDVLPYFIKSENNISPAHIDSPYHGTRGPLTVSDVNQTNHNVLQDMFLMAGEELGYTSADLNAPWPENARGIFMHNQVNVLHGTRQSTATAYLRPVVTRGNLHVVTDTLVTKVLFDGTRAIGVEYKTGNGDLKTVRAEEEVILSSGTIGSAHLLLLSGIGPRDQLEAVGIPVVAELPVGDFLKDHVYMPLTQYTIDKPLSFIPETVNTISQHVRYEMFGSGVWGHACGIHGHALFLSEHQPNGDRMPYYKVCFLGQAIASSRDALLGYAEQSNHPPEVAEASYGGIEGRHAITIIPDILRPRSAGTLRLRTADPLDHPLIDPAYLTDPLDVKVFIEAIHMTTKIANTSVFRSIGAQARRLQHPDCNHDDGTDEQLECIIRQMALTEYHPVGTCRMGAAGDARAVVDPRLRVHGVSGLRVVDASIMPEIVSANTNAAVIMIAEKGADMIKEERRGRS